MEGLDERTREILRLRFEQFEIGERVGRSQMLTAHPGSPSRGAFGLGGEPGGATE